MLTNITNDFVKLLRHSVASIEEFKVSDTFFGGNKDWVIYE